MTTLYIVGEVGFEYNDEIYHTGESNTVTPTQAYKVRANAELAVSQQTIATLLETNLGYYTYGADDDIFKDPDFAQSLVRRYDEALANKMQDEDEYFYEYGEDVCAVLKKFTPEEQLAFAKNLEIQFYRVYEVEVEDE